MLAEQLRKHVRLGGAHHHVRTAEAGQAARLRPAHRFTQIIL